MKGSSGKISIFSDYCSEDRKVEKTEDDDVIKIEMFDLTQRGIPKILETPGSEFWTFNDRFVYFITTWKQRMRQKRFRSHETCQSSVSIRASHRIVLKLDSFGHPVFSEQEEPTRRMYELERKHLKVRPLFLFSSPQIRKWAARSHLAKKARRLRRRRHSRSNETWRSLCLIMLLPCILLLGAHLSTAMPFDYYGMFIEQMLAEQLSEIVKNNTVTVTVNPPTQKPSLPPLGHPILKEIVQG